MKSRMHKKLLRLAVAELILQLGFERATEQAICLLTDILAHYTESLCSLTVPFESCDPDPVIKFLISEFYGASAYQIGELFQFIDQQSQLKSLIKGGVADESILHMLKVLPPDINLRNTQRSMSTLMAEDKNNPAQVIVEASMDEHMEQFIKRCAAEKGSPAPRVECEYRNISRLVLDSANEGVPPTPAVFAAEAIFDQEEFEKEYPEHSVYMVYKGA